MKPSKPSSGPVDNSASPHCVLRSIPFSAIRITGGFWERRQSTNRQLSLKHGYDMLEKAGNFQNLRLAAGLAEGRYQGRLFIDSDVYKWLEAVAYELHMDPDSGLQQRAEEAIDLIAAAQQRDGYLNSYYQVVEPGHRWTDLDFGHELYCAGHLFQAAVAYYRATQTPKLLEVATRFADLLCDTFGPDKLQGACGHPEIEMALVELYRVTGKSNYLDLAKFFIDQRGRGVMRGLGWAGAEYHQDRVPVRQAARVEGHAVRAMYLNAGVADLYLETGERELLNALERQWQDMVGHKMFLTGGLGSRYEGEAFGDPYELPADLCYCETCAAIGSVMWNWRMLLITGEGRFADLMERTLYNGVISGVALDGKHYFYMNPLLSRGGLARQPWYEVACCPPNLMRLLASLAHYVATQDDRGLQIHLYTTADLKVETISGNTAALSMRTDYPWQGQVRIVIRETAGLPWQLRLRIPEWTQQVAIAINELPVANPMVESGYVALERTWQPGDVVDLTMAIEPYLIEANPRVDAVRGCIALERGPIVYCIEAVDHPDFNLMDVQLDETAPLEAVWREDILPEGASVVSAGGVVPENAEWRDRLYRRFSEAGRQSGKHAALTAIPYYAWANRGMSAMRIWIPRARVS